jgi:hypothetical protein
MGMLEFGPGKRGLVPALGRGPIAHFEPVDIYWNELVYVLDEGKTRLRRQDIVLGAAHKEGGAHVDPNLTPEYKRLVEDGAVGELFEVVGGQEVRRTPLTEAHFVCLRDMAYEMLHSPELMDLAT